MSRSMATGVTRRGLAVGLAAPITALAAALFSGLVAPAGAEDAPFGPGDPLARDASKFDPRRPPEHEMQISVPDGFVVASVGDMIISRPLSAVRGATPDVQGRHRAAAARRRHVRQPGDDDLRSAHVQGRTVLVGWRLDQCRIAARGTRPQGMGFALVARANNHVMDWGPKACVKRATGSTKPASSTRASARRMGSRARRSTSRARQVALHSSRSRPRFDPRANRCRRPGRLRAVGAQRVAPDASRQRAADGAEPLARLQCALYGKPCGEIPTEGRLFGTNYRQAERLSYDHVMNPEDLAEIHRSIRSAQQNADFVIVSIHSHECSTGCDDDQAPRGPAVFLKQLAHAAIDSGADIFVTTGNHNLGPIEIYRSPTRGYRPIFYGLGNFFWSDIQELLPHDLFQGNRALLADAWQDPAKATEYDLTAPLNKAYFAHAFTFQSVIAECRFAGNDTGADRVARDRGRLWHDAAGERHSARRHR